MPNPWLPWLYEGACPLSQSVQSLRHMGAIDDSDPSDMLVNVPKDLIITSDRDLWRDSRGAPMMTMTRGPFGWNGVGELVKAAAEAETSEACMRAFSSSQDVKTTMSDFRGSATGSQEKHFLPIDVKPAAAPLRTFEDCRFDCEMGPNAFGEEAGAQVATVFAILEMYPQRDLDRSFSVGFGSRWHFMFLDYVEPIGNSSYMPALGNMLLIRLIKVIQGLDFLKLLKQCS